MATEKNIKEVRATEADFKTNAADKNDGFLSDVTGYPMTIKRGTNRDYWTPDYTKDSGDSITYNDKTVANINATEKVKVGEKIEDIDDANLNIEFDSTNKKIIFNVNGVAMLSVTSKGILFANGWEIRPSENYLGFFKDGVYAGTAVGNFTSSSSSSSSTGA